MREMARGHIAYADGELVVIDLTTAVVRAAISAHF
jgi:hypothetical protein